MIGTRGDVQFAPYNQPLQTLLDPSGLFARTAQDGTNVLLIRWEDLGQFSQRGEDALAQIEKNGQELLRAIRSASESFRASLIFAICPGSPRFAASHSTWLADWNERAAASLDEVPGVQVLLPETISRFYPVAEWDSPQGEQLGRIPYTDLYYCALGTSVVRLALALASPPYKLIALDCDNTLWKGICGEDGPGGITLDSARRYLQEFMLQQRQAGMLLCLASKNNERDVFETFEQNRQMPLRPEHFTAWRINWQNKPANLSALADELGLGLDSLVFVDDNPRESGEVEDALPEVLSLTLPEEDDAIPHFLDHVWAFDHPVVTEEDRHRSTYYSQTQEFGKAIRSAASLEHFYKNLGLRVSIDPLIPERLARAAQLTQRTNQFNFTTVRRSESEIQVLLSSGFRCLTAEAADRFGDYGVVGVMILRDLPREVEVNTLLLSCRALGRGVEHKLMQWVGRDARDRGAEHVAVSLTPTTKNAPAQLFLESIGDKWRERTDNGLRFRFPVSELAGLEWKPTAAVENQPAPKRNIGGTKPRRFQMDYQRIATTLSKAEQILDEMRQMRRASGNGADVADPPSGDVEVRLAGIWSDLLERAAISRNDNFFDIGGHSLLAVLLLVRIKEAFDVELHIDDVYSGTTTLAGMAATIEAHAMGAVNADEYAALLAEIEQLSDEEVRALLEQEESNRSAD